jgi:hypothetical protein
MNTVFKVVTAGQTYFVEAADLEAAVALVKLNYPLVCDEEATSVIPANSQSVDRSDQRQMAGPGVQGVAYEHSSDGHP